MWGHHLVRPECLPNELPPGVHVPRLHSLANFKLDYLASGRGGVGASDQRDHRAGTGTGGTIGPSQVPKRCGRSESYCWGEHRSGPTVSGGRWGRV